MRLVPPSHHQRQLSRYTTQLRIFQQLLAASFMIKEIAQDFTPAFACWPQVFSFVTYSIAQATIDLLLVTRIVAVRAPKWQIYAYYTWIFCFHISLRTAIGVTFVQNLLPSGVCTATV